MGVLRVPQEPAATSLGLRVLSAVMKWFGSGFIRSVQGVTEDSRDYYDFYTSEPATLSLWLTFFGLREDVDFWILAPKEQ